MDTIIVHPRILHKHPKLSEHDIVTAWHHCIKSAVRLDKGPDYFLAVGTDAHGRLIELSARQIGFRHYLIYHAFTPPTRVALYELGLTNRR